MRNPDGEPLLLNLVLLEVATFWLRSPMGGCSVGENNRDVYNHDRLLATVMDGGLNLRTFATLRDAFSNLRCHQSVSVDGKEAVHLSVLDLNFSANKYMVLPLG
jgi:hypothetical protein